jgi:hypothetical protein
MNPTRFLTVAVLALAAACSDPSSIPTAPGSPAAKGSTLGNPQFAQQFTTCSPAAPVPSGTTDIGCDYKITGGGNTESATITLAAPVLMDGQCQNNGGQIVPVKNWGLTVSATQPNVSFQNGQITASIAVSLSQAQLPSARTVCPNGNWRLQNTSTRFAGGYQLSAEVFSGNASIVIYSQFTF